jgi:hypothetical protein
MSKIKSLQIAKKVMIAGGIAAMALHLTGCSGEPSEAEMRAIFKGEFDAAKNMGGMVGQMMAKTVPEFVSLEKKGCTARKPTGYTCDVLLELKPVNSDQTRKNPMTISFVEGESGWVRQ